jgi:dTDP-glucose 4,6-dehydratase
MKYLITGGAGFIGSNFIHFLFNTYPDCEVINLDKLTYAGNLDNLKDLEKNPRYHFVQGDVADEKVVNELVPLVDVIVNFAAETHVDRSIFDPGSFVRTNVLGTYVLLEAARKSGNKRFHHISTDEVYGSIPLESDEAWVEESPYRPRSPYSASKAAADHLARAYANTFNLPVSITNCANNVGPYMYPEKLIPLAVTNLLEGKNVPVYAPGNQIREWLYVEDHCGAIDLIIRKGEAGSTYFVGPDETPVTNLEIIKKILKIMNLPEERIDMVKDRPGHDLKYSLNTNKIKKELGWSPRYSLDETLQKTVEWYMNNQNWWKKIKASQEYLDYYKKQYNQ